VLKKLTIGIIVLVTISNINGMSRKRAANLLAGQSSKIKNSLLLSQKPNMRLYSRVFTPKQWQTILTTKIRQSKKPLITAISIATALDYFTRKNSNLNTIINTKYPGFDIDNINAININKSGEILLIEIIKNNDIETLKLLLQHKNLDINAQDKDGWTALMESTARSNKEIVKILIDAGADVEVLNKHGSNALMMSDNLEIVQILIDAGADVNATDWLGFTALSRAIALGQELKVKALLNAGANVNRVDTFGKGNSDLIKVICSKSLRSHKKEIIKMFLNIGSYVDQQNSDGKTALIFATEEGDQELVEILLDHGANVNAKVALKIAASNNYKKIVQLLLERCKFNIEDLFEAIYPGETEEVAEELMKSLPKLVYDRLKVLKPENNYLDLDDYVNYLFEIDYARKMQCKSKTQSCGHLRAMRSPKHKVKFLQKLSKDSSLYVMLYDMHNTERIYNEQDMATFIHAQKNEFAFLEDIYTALVRRIVDSTTPQDYLYIRYLDIEQHQALSLIESIKENFKRKKLMRGIDNNERTSEQLFMNAFIVGGCFHYGTCSIECFLDDKSVFPDISIKDIFNKLGIESIYNKYSQELKELRSMYYRLNPHGRILQIAVPNEIVDNIVYMSAPNGKRIPFEQNGKEYSAVSELLKDVKEKPENFMHNWQLDRIEYVMVLTRNIALNPHSGIKIIPYESIAYADKESPEYNEYQAYLKGFNELMNTIAKEVIK